MTWFVVFLAFISLVILLWNLEFVQSSSGTHNCLLFQLLLQLEVAVWQGSGLWEINSRLLGRTALLQRGQMDLARPVLSSPNLAGVVARYAAVFLQPLSAQGWRLKPVKWGWWHDTEEQPGIAEQMNQPSNHPFQDILLSKNNDLYLLTLFLIKHVGSSQPNRSSPNMLNVCQINEYMPHEIGSWEAAAFWSCGMGSPPQTCSENRGHTAFYYTKPINPPWEMNTSRQT